jgi:Flp pilus assembly protein TadD
MGLAAFLPAVDNHFVGYDDPLYVTANAVVQRGFTWDGTVWAFSNTEAANWHPLTWLSHLLDCQLYGLNPAGHHLTSLLLHALNILLAFVVLRRMTGATWRSFFVAALFGLHPLRVESVTWVAERKDVLSTTFWLLTLWAYAAYVGARDMRPARRGVFFLLALLAFAGGLMSKPMLVTLPFTLLLLDYWPLQRLKNTGLVTLIFEKLPFLLLATAASVVTFLVQRQAGAMDAMIPFNHRLSNAFISVLRYVGKVFWPVDLAFFYPLPQSWPPGAVALAVVTLVGVSLLVVTLHRRAPFLATGWFWFVGTLVPVLGLVQVGQQSMADRYTYIPTLGIFVALVWGLHQCVAGRNLPARSASFTAVVAVLLCGALTRQQTRHWQDTEHLARHALAVTRDNYVAHDMLGDALAKQGHFAEALREHREALRIQPNNADVHNNLAVALQKTGQRDEALEHYQLALKLRPRFPEAHYNLGTALEQAGRLPEAIDSYSRALAQRPNHIDARFNLATVLLHLERFDEAIVQFQLVLKLDPNSPDTFTNLGVTYDRQGKLDEAVRCYQRVIELKPDDAKTYFNLGVALQRKGMIGNATRCFEEAIRLKPDYADAHTNLDALLGLQSRLNTTNAPTGNR